MRSVDVANIVAGMHVVAAESKTAETIRRPCHRHRPIVAPVAVVVVVAVIPRMCPPDRRDQWPRVVFLGLDGAPSGALGVLQLVVLPRGMMVVWKSCLYDVVARGHARNRGPRDSRRAARFGPAGLTVGLRSPAGMVLEECRLLDPLPPSAPSRKSGSCARRATWVFFAEELVIPADGLSGSPCSGRMLESQDEHSAGSDYRR